MITTEDMDLLNPESDYYVLKEKWWDWGGGDIYGQNGAVVGRMHRRMISLRAFTEISDRDGSFLFSVEKKLISMRPS
ncbi:hypothetical protein MUP59_06925, partial [Candidatus Bathyarchaeota archaeon]|nr:hypothetical protein [Candidatus Bathyarchaeota archaeon]